MSVELLEKAITGFLNLLDSVDDDNWDSHTACEGWDVNDLVDHIVSGATMTVAVLRGSSADDAVSAMPETSSMSVPEKRAAASGSAAEHVAAFRALSSLDVVVHHPAMDMPAGQLLGFRIGDYLLHTWDLARAFGQDVQLDADAVAFMWEILQPMAPMLASTGRFGEGPSGTVPETAPLQARLIDLTGRRA